MLLTHEKSAHILNPSGQILLEGHSIIDFLNEPSGHDTENSSVASLLNTVGHNVLTSAYLTQTPLVHLSNPVAHGHSAEFLAHFPS